MVDAERLRKLGRRTIVFIDEIHRFNKAQQDAFLPYVERGDIILIGATTENPSFEINAVCLPARGFTCFCALTTEEIVVLLRRRSPHLEPRVTATDEMLEKIAAAANGDVRSAYNTLEVAAAGSPRGVIQDQPPNRCAGPQGSSLR